VITSTKGWYKTRAWASIRAKRLQRDGWQCRMCKAMLGTGRKSDDGPVRAAVVDHVIPHKGDRALFFNTDNTQALCKECHDTRKQRAERLGYDPTPGDDGWPTDPAHPAAG